MSKKIVYIAHPISGAIDDNLADLARILRIINMNIHPKKNCIFHNLAGEKYVAPLFFEFSNIIPLAPYYADIIALDDNNALERKRGIENDIAILSSGLFKELWLTGESISLGMREEIKLAVSLGIEVLDYINKF